MVLPLSKDKSPKRDISNRTTTRVEAPSSPTHATVLTLVKEAAIFSPVTTLKEAASTVLIIFGAVKENTAAYERLGDISRRLIIAIWRSYKKTVDPEEWLSTEMREILEELTLTLRTICSFIQDKLSRNRAIRLLFSRAHAIKINAYYEHLKYIMHKFELQSHMNIIIQLVRKNDQIWKQILHRNDEEEDIDIISWEEAEEVERPKQIEIDRERQHSDELKKIEKETKDRETELERLRGAVSAVEEVNRLKEAQEKEIAELRQQLAATEDRRRSTTTTIQTTLSMSESPGWKDGIEEEWGGDTVVETMEEEGGVWPSKISSRVKRNPSKLPNRRPAALESPTEEEEEDLKSLRKRPRNWKRVAPQKLPLPVQKEMGDEFSDEEDDYEPPPLIKSLKVMRQSPSVGKDHEKEVEKGKAISVLDRLKQIETDHLAKAEQRRSDELKKIEKETKDCYSELERLQAAASAVEVAFKKAQVGELFELRQHIAAEEDRQQRIIVQAQLNKKRTSSWKDEVEEEDWGGDTMVEGATSEREGVKRPARKNSKVNRNPSKLPNTASEDYMGDDEEDWKSLRNGSKTRVPHWKEREDECTDEEKDYVHPSPRKNKRRSQSSSGSPPTSDLDNLIAQIKDLRLGGHGSHLGSPTYSPHTHFVPHYNAYFPTYGPPFSPPMGPYGYGIDGPGTRVNSGVGNITNMTISNVGNNTSVKEVSRPRNQRRHVASGKMKFEDNHSQSTGSRSSLSYRK